VLGRPAGSGWLASGFRPLDFHETDGEIAPQHDAFLVGEDDFEEIHGRIRDRGLDHRADPMPETSSCSTRRAAERFTSSACSAWRASSKATARSAARSTL
jgi:hypothetical protein